MSNRDWAAAPWGDKSLQSSSLESPVCYLRWSSSFYQSCPKGNAAAVVAVGTSTLLIWKRSLVLPALLLLMARPSALISFVWLPGKPQFS